MESFSPVTRKIVSAGLLVLVLLVAAQLILMPLAGAIAEKREELADLRGRAAHLTAVLDARLPLMSQIPAHATIKAGTREAALGRLRGTVSQAATAAGVALGLPSAMSPGKGDGSDIGLNLSATGSEEALIRFTAILEHGDQTVRFRNWHIQAGATPDQPLALTGQVVAIWERQG